MFACADGRCPSPHRRRRRLRSGDGGVRAWRRDLQDAGQRADGQPAERPRSGGARDQAARHHAHPAAPRVAASCCGRTRSLRCPLVDRARRSTTTRSVTRASSPPSMTPSSGRSRSSGRHPAVGVARRRRRRRRRALDADGTTPAPSTGGEAVGLEPAPGDAPLATHSTACAIVEFATFFAAPYGDRLLSDLGAEVIKVEGIDGDPMRPLPEMFEGANRGKRAIAADLKHPRRGRLVARASRGRRRRPAQPAAGRRRTPRHRRRHRCRRPTRASSTTTRPATDRPDRSRCCRASRRCCRASSAHSPIGAGEGQPPARNVRQRGLLQRAARRVRRCSP